MSQELVPFGYSFKSAALPVPEMVQPLPDGQSQCIHIACTPESQGFILSTFRTWFADWDHVVLVDHGSSAKREESYIFMEWDGCYIDLLFLQILESDPSVIDYVVYVRDEEV